MIVQNMGSFQRTEQGGYAAGSHFLLCILTGNFGRPGTGVCDAGGVTQMAKFGAPIRMRNPMFWAQILLSVIMPILAYLGLTAEDLSSWSVLGEVLIKAVSSPYILSLVIVSVYNAITDPTTTGFTDSKRALTYDTPNSDKE